MAKVTMPTLPMNINKIRTSLPGIESAGETPVDRPTVAKADTTSKAAFITGIPSMAHKYIVDNKTAIAAKKNIAKARKTTSEGIAREKITVSCLPRIKVQPDAKITAKVDVLMPPPVDEGDAPMNINIIISSKAGSVN